MNYAPENKMPWITKSLIQAVLPENTGPYKIDENAIDFMYDMAHDEVGFDKSMVNRGNIVKMVMNEWKDAGFPMSLEDTPEEFLDIGRKAEHAYLGRPDTLSGPSLLDYAKKYDDKYDIYSDKGLSTLNEIIAKDLLNIHNVRDLYHNKYKEQYRGRVTE